MHQQTLFVFVFIWLPWAFYICDFRLAQAGTFSEAAQTFMTMNALAAAASCLTPAKVFVAARGPDSRTRFKRRSNFEDIGETIFQFHVVKTKPRSKSKVLYHKILNWPCKEKFIKAFLQPFKLIKSEHCIDFCK